MLVMKAFGAALLLLAAAGVGREAARNYLNRPGELRGFLLGLQVLETEIGFGRTPLPQALQQAALACGGTARAALEACARQLPASGGELAGTAWLQALEQTLPAGPLNREDRAVLQMLAGSLGGSDAEDQLKHLELCRERLKRLLAQADDERERSARLWSYGGAVVGLLLVLVLI